jgi:hypothetical protein
MTILNGTPASDDVSRLSSAQQAAKFLPFMDDVCQSEQDQGASIIFTLV